MTTLNELRALAANQAAELGAEFVGSEHLFLAWLAVGGETPLGIVHAAGLDADGFRRMLADRPSRRVTTSKAPAPDGDLATAEAPAIALSEPAAEPRPPDRPLDWSSHARRAVTVAETAAAAEGREATADDLGWALIREPRGAVARALATHQIKPGQLRPVMAPRPPKGRPAGEPASPVAAKAPGDEAPQPTGSRAPKSAGQKPLRPPRQPVESASRPRPADSAGRVSGEAHRGRADRNRSGRDPEIDDIPEARPPERPRLVPAPPPAPPRPARLTAHWWTRVPATTPLLLAVPAAAWLDATGGSAMAVFLTASAGLVPLAAWMGRATGQLCDRSGPALGGLLNATFGNAAELIIGFAALRAGYVELVRASITGSILGNLLLLLGLALFTGGIRRPVLSFNRAAAGMAAVMLSLAVAGLVFPAIVQMAHPRTLGPHALSVGVAIILMVTYLLSLVFVFGSHRPAFALAPRGSSRGRPWPLWAAIAALAVAAGGVAVASELLVGVIEPVTRSLGMSQVFLGLILIPLVGNAAEHATAIGAAARGEIDLSLQIALGSSTQVALMVAPILVLAGALLGSPLDLVFPMFELAALATGVVVSTLITLDGESHWMEGVQLLGLYAMVAVAAWFI